MKAMGIILHIAFVMLKLQGGMLMDTFEKVIGYDDIKEELLKIADMFKNPEEYKEIGAFIPKGVMISGKPGMGKSLIASEFAKICGCRSITLRKTRRAGYFIEKINNAFYEAKKMAPYVIILDDLDKFISDENSQEEYYTVQGCIDEVADKDVLVVATANYTGDMPESLLREGRFDYLFSLDELPDGVSEKIVLKNLEQLEIEPNLKKEDILMLFKRASPAKIITVLNNCKISMKYYKEDTLLRNILIDEFIKNEGIGYDLTLSNKKDLQKAIAYHEAGHLAVREMIQPGSVRLAAINIQEGSIKGIVYGNPKYESYMSARKNICEALAGMAAEEQKFGFISDGSTKDIIDVNYCLEADVQSGKYGLDIAIAGLNDTKPASDKIYKQIESEKKRLYSITKKALVDNWDFVEEVAQKLIECETLMHSDIQEIRKKYSLRDFVV